MVTLFTTAKPFRDHAATIQRNALKSWTFLHPDVEVILFGDEEGVADVARELGLRHEPQVERCECGTKRLDYMFARAQQIARHSLLCYSNCDIILLPEFCGALERVSSLHSRFLMVGRRWDTDITNLVEFGSKGAETQIRQLAHRSGIQRGTDAVDYFAFRRGFYQHIPPLVVGRLWWDHWIVWKARQMGVDVVDVSGQVTAIHQNHGYGYHPAGAGGVWTDELTKRNYDLAGGRWHLYTIADATHVLEASGERRNWLRFWPPYWRFLRPKLAPAWMSFLETTRPVRHKLGLRKL